MITAPILSDIQIACLERDGYVLVSGALRKSSGRCRRLSKGRIAGDDEHVWNVIPALRRHDRQLGCCWASLEP